MCFNFLNKQNNLVKRILWGEIIWFILSLSGFLMILFFYSKPEYNMFMWWFLFWYTTIWAIIGFLWIFDRHPIFTKWKMYLWRWILIWAYMNIMLVLFTYNILIGLGQEMFWEIVSTSSLFFWAIIEWAIVWLIIDYIITKKFGEGESLLKK